MDSKMALPQPEELVMVVPGQKMVRLCNLFERGAEVVNAGSSTEITERSSDE